MTVQFQEKVSRLRELLRSQCEEVQVALDRSLESLITRNGEMGESVRRGDATIDEREIAIEDLCLEIITLHQPYADDMRYLVSVLRINNDLERIGDLAVRIAKRATFLSLHENVGIPVDLTSMVSRARKMVFHSIEALMKQDAGAARQVCEADDSMDALRKEGQERITRDLSRDPEHSRELVRWLAVVRHLERIGDMATDIAEDVIYMVEGVIVRHNWKAPTD